MPMDIPHSPVCVSNLSTTKATITENKNDTHPESISAGKFICGASAMQMKAPTPSLLEYLATEWNKLLSVIVDFCRYATLQANPTPRTFSL